jgi:hypothetical protein
LTLDPLTLTNSRAWAAAGARVVVRTARAVAAVASQRAAWLLLQDTGTGLLSFEKGWRAETFRREPGESAWDQAM